MLNDIAADSPTSLYVTDNHKYSEGLMRILEDLGTQQTAPSAKTIHVQITDLDIITLPLV